MKLHKKENTADKMAQLKRNAPFSSYMLAVLFIILLSVGERDSNQHNWQLTHAYLQQTWYSKSMVYLCETPLICIKTFSIVTEYKTYQTFRRKFVLKRRFVSFIVSDDEKISNVYQWIFASYILSKNYMVRYISGP
jgi:hypothetical protein